MQATLPWSWYSDPEVLRVEEDRIFRRAWQYVGHTGQVADPGTYFASRAGHVPVVVTRAADGELRAFLNVCRHRGSLIAEGEGRRSTLQCAYHAWTYALDGELRAAPRAEREPGFEKDELALAPVQLATWGPFIFVNPDLDAAPLEEALGELPEQVAEVVDVTALRFGLRSAYELAANWKIACENFLECYHCAVAHPGFSAVIDVSPDAYRLEAGRLHSSQFAPLRGGGDGRGQFHFLWPNLKINIFPGTANLSIGPVLPVTAERSAGFLDYFFAADADEAWVEELLEFDNQVGREDTVLVERVQQGVRSGVLAQGRLLGESEQLIAHFQRLVADALA